MRYSLCIEPIFEDVDFYDRIKLAAEAGLDAIEFWDCSNKDCAKVGKLARQEKLAVAICCLGDAWGRRLTGDPAAVVSYFKEMVPRLRDMDCHAVIGLSGDLDGKADTQKNILIENLKRLAEVAEKEKITVCVEALNSIRDHKGYYLDSSTVGFEIMKCVNSPYIKLLYDIYHMQIMEGNVIENVTANIAYIGHFHSAGVPGRNEHQNGETDYVNVQKTIEKTTYDKYFGLEYWPAYDNKKSLKDVLAYLKRR
jgi:hydroxypyruvate isomerase